MNGFDDERYSRYFLDDAFGLFFQNGTVRALRRPHGSAYGNFAFFKFGNPFDDQRFFTDKAFAVRFLFSDFQLFDGERPGESEQHSGQYEKNEQLPGERQRSERYENHDERSRGEPNRRQPERNRFNRRADDCDAEPKPRQMFYDKIEHTDSIYGTIVSG